MVYRCIVWVGPIMTPEQQQKLADLSKKSYLGVAFRYVDPNEPALSTVAGREQPNHNTLLETTMDPENCWLLHFNWGRREGSGNGVRERCKKVGQSKGQPHRRIGQKERHGRPTWQCFDQGGHQGWFRPRGSGGL